MGNSSAKAGPADAEQHDAAMVVFPLQDVVSFGFKVSARRAKELVRSGRVMVDGQVALDRTFSVAVGSLVVYTDDDGRVQGPVVVHDPSTIAPEPEPPRPPPVAAPPVVAQPVAASLPAQQPGVGSKPATRAVDRQRELREERARARATAAQRQRTVAAAKQEARRLAIENALAAERAAVHRANLYEQQVRNALLDNTPEPLAPGVALRREFVLLDCRLEMAGINRIDEVCEILADERSDESSYACPIDDAMLGELSWKREADGYMPFPAVPPVYVGAMRISNEWFHGLRYHVDSTLRSIFRYTMMSAFRVFVLPIPAENCARVILATNQLRLTVNMLRKEPVGRLVAHYLAMPDVGEWPSTRPRVFRTTRGAAYNEAETGVITTPTAYTPRAGRVRTFGDALVTPRSGAAEVGFGGAACAVAGPAAAGPAAAGSAAAGSAAAGPAAAGPAAAGSAAAGSAAAGSAAAGPAAAGPAAAGSAAAGSAAAGPAAAGPAAAGSATATSAATASAAAGSTTAGRASAEHTRGARPVLSVEIPAAPASAVAGAARHMADASAMGFGSPRTPAGMMLYPHQRRTVAWMLAREALADTPGALTVMPIERTGFRFESGRYLECDRDGFGEVTRARLDVGGAIELPAGGIVAHPVGAGKTVITAALMGQVAAAAAATGKRNALTLIFVPAHLTGQWRNELERFVPTLRVAIADNERVLERPDLDVALVPHSAVADDGYRAVLTAAGRTWHRVVFDEPQDQLAQNHAFALVTHLCARHRWLLTATPTPFLEILELAWGHSAKARNIEALRMLFVARCGIRDAPQDCLPVPPIHYEMRPIALTWQETSVVHMHALAGHLQASIQLASYFANVDSFGNVQGNALAVAAREAAQGDAGVQEPSASGEQQYSSLDGWVAKHQAAIESRLAAVTSQLKLVNHEIEHAVFQARAARAQRAEAAAADAAARPALSREQLEAELARRLSAMPTGPTVTLTVVDAETRAHNAAFAPVRLALPRAWEVEDTEAETGRADAVWAEFVADVWDAFRQRVLSIATADGEEIDDCRTAAAESELFVVLVPSPRTDWALRAERRFRRQLVEVGLDESRSIQRDDANALDAAAGVDPELIAQRSALEKDLTTQQGLLAFMRSVADSLAKDDNECSVCLEEMRGQVVSVLGCLHAFCAACVTRMFGDSSAAICPMCRTPANRRNLCTFKCIPAAEADAAASATAAAAAASGKSAVASAPFRGSKLMAICELVTAITAQSADEKVLLFAQWPPLLAHISAALRECGIAHASLDGAMEARADTLERFRTESSPRVLLLSYESHASGANLDVANHCIIVHPYVPPHVASATVIPLALAQAFERQAVGRVHRFPQARETHVYRFYARGTAEDDIYTTWGFGLRH